MKKGKKLLVLFLALNAVMAAYAKGEKAPVSSRYDRMYNNIVRNIEQGKPNEKNYQLIERILKQRNKELKDLHTTAPHSNTRPNQWPRPALRAVSATQRPDSSAASSAR